MVKSRKELLSYFYLAFSLYASVKILGIHIGTFYNGIPYQGKIFFYAVYVLLHMGMTMHLFGYSEQFFSNYGIYMLVRYQSKRYIYYKCLMKIYQKVVMYNIVSVLLCFMFTEIFFRDVDVKPSNVCFFLLKVFVDICLATLQMLFEMVSDAKWALCLTSMYYIVSITITDFLYYYDICPHSLIFFPIFSMRYRMEISKLSWFEIVLQLAVLLTGFVYTGEVIARKKDFL